MRLLVRLGWFVLLSGFLIALFAGSFYVAMRLVFVGREVKVPDLAGLTVDEARSTLNRSELYLDTAAERFDERIPKGCVQSQDPPAGATIKKNRKVRVTVSLGPLEIAIPDLAGQTLRTAQIALQRGGLSVGHVTSTHTTAAPPDVVMAQHPPASGPQGAVPGGAETVSTSGGQAAVDLLVSRGPDEPVYVMPDLARRRLDEVTMLVKRTGLRLGAVRRENTPGLPRGLVVKQYPEAGYPVGRQEIISLVLSE
ncbi:MAG TPA: PASTA domain-containing protein [Candidatus Polarisedimenticolia bacterium]|jgi:beta-lactam-binding protein with PASTA domain